MSKEGLATKVSVSSDRMAKEAFTLFEIEIELTEKGDQNYFKVIEIVYLLINNLSSTGAQPYIYKEM